MRCFQTGHWKDQCPLNNRQQPTPADGLNPQSVARGVSANLPNSETYLNIDVDGNTVQCLIDSGCDQSVIGRRMAKSAVLTPTKIELFAANGSPLNVLGTMRLCFKVQGRPLFADLLVSDSIDELLLGYDWLSRNHCEWQFDKATLSINGIPVGLKSRQAKTSVRRIYVRETVSIPANMQMNVPVKLPISSWRTPLSDWLTEPRQIKPGVFAASTLLSHCDEFAAVRFINISADKFLIREGLCIGKAVPGVATCESEPIVSDVSPRTGRLASAGLPVGEQSVNIDCWTTVQDSTDDFLKGSTRAGVTRLAAVAGEPRDGTFGPGHNYKPLNAWPDGDVDGRSASVCPKPHG